MDTIVTNSSTKGIIQPTETPLIVDSTKGMTRGVSSVSESQQSQELKLLSKKVKLKQHKKPKYNPIRKAILKKALKKGIDAKNSMLEAGYHPNTAHTATARRIVKDCRAEIAKELKAKDIDADWLVKEFENLKTKALSIKQKNDLTNANRSVEAIARVVSIGSHEKQVINITNVPTNEEEFTQRILDRLKSVKT